jgi:starvation-inducible DNA-binding protein
MQGENMGFAPAGMKPDVAERLAEVLQSRLDSLIDLGLTLKHVHWNVVGPGFIGVHQMLDDHVDGVRLASDAVAERIAALGGIPNGLAGGLVDRRTWDDYPVGRATVQAHLGALDMAYDGVIGGHRDAITETEALDVVTNDLLIGQAATLEQYQWLVRAHLENTSGELATHGADTALDAAAQAAAADPLQ